MSHIPYSHINIIGLCLRICLTISLKFFIRKIFKFKLYKQVFSLFKSVDCFIIAIRNILYIIKNMNQRSFLQLYPFRPYLPFDSHFISFYSKFISSISFYCLIPPTNSFSNSSTTLKVLLRLLQLYELVNFLFIQSIPLYI